MLRFMDAGLIAGMHQLMASEGHGWRGGNTSTARCGPTRQPRRKNAEGEPVHARSSCGHASSQASGCYRTLAGRSPQRTSIMFKTFVATLILATASVALTSKVTAGPI